MRTWLGKTKEAMGVLPAMGVKAIIEEIEKGVTGENAATPGALMYTVTLRVIEPDRFKGASLRDWFPIGTKDDRGAKREETWRRSEGGPGKLVRMLKRAGIAIVDDDEEWMEAAEGQEVCLVVLKQRDNRDGEWRNRVGLYFRESDDDFIGIGEETEAAEDGARRTATGRPAKAEPRGVVSARAKAKATVEDDDEEEEAPPSPRKVKAKKPEEEEEEEAAEEEEESEEEEAPKARKVAAKVKAKKKPVDDDEDEDEE